MQQTLTPSTANAAATLATGAALHHPPMPCDAAPAQAIGERPTSRGFAALLAAYRATGGTARGDDVARLLEDHGRADFIGLARLIAAGRVFGFEWRRTLWIPMFQFEVRDLSIKPAAERVVKELGSTFDGWACAAWFATPNSWLDRRAPVDLVDTQLRDVLGAARTDRFIAVG
jgi:hypothetical protein